MRNIKTVAVGVSLAALTAATSLLPLTAANADDWGGRGGDRHDAPRYSQTRDHDGYVERQRVVTTERVERDGYRGHGDNYRDRDGYVVRDRDRYDNHPVVVRERDRYDEPAPVVVVHERPRYSEPAPVIVERDYPRENLQQSKNNARNVAIGGLAAAAVGVLTHNSTLTAVGAIGAVAGGAAYENDRHAQSDRQAWRDSHDYRGW